MQSITRTVPSSVSNSVSKTRVLPRYRREMRFASPRGLMLQVPFVSSPRSAANTAGESKRGAQSQSMDPFLATRAAVRMLPMSA
jgi:hypothetical protein